VGITASVMCRCFQEGRTTPCPFPDQFVADPQAMPSLEWPHEPDEDEAAEAYEALQLWLATCCPHRNLTYAQEFIASWKGFQAFSDALEEIGAERFPHLMAQLPDGDEGVTSPEVAALMLAELDDFARAQSAVRHAVLIDDERGEVISMGSHILSGALAVDAMTGLDVGFNAQGFFVRDRWEMNRLLFQSMHLEQRLLHPESSQVEYVDLANGRSFVCNTPFGPIMTGEDGLPRMAFLRMRVDLQPSSESRFAYLIEPLRRVLQASVEMNHPVRWH
jgi:hypothetical protein